MNPQTVQTVQLQHGTAYATAAAPLRHAFSAGEIVLRHLTTPAEVAGVVHLREEIDLSVHAAAGPQFLALEKKETSAVSSSVSSWMAN